MTRRPTGFETEIAELVWRTRYRQPGEEAVADTWRRVARTLASEETADRPTWEERFFAALSGFRLLPGGRILAGAGAAHPVTLFNCFVMGPVPDDMAGIFDALKEGALTLQQGGGVGYDFSTLRPAGLLGARYGGIASGPVSFMHIWDAMCATLRSTGARRGAMMGTLRCDHPDIESFIDAKRDPRALRHFNLSVLVTDAFMDAVARDADWPLLFPLANMSEADRARHPERIERPVEGGGTEVCAVLGRLSAGALWDRLMRATYETAEPGVLFIDRINALNNLHYLERIIAANPCGEIPLPAYGACDLGSINLAAFVAAPFTTNARLDLEGVAATAATATRLLDNVIDASPFPLPAQAARARDRRRIGLGITGLADALIMLGLDYGSAPARALATDAMRTVCHAAYRTSVDLATEKGAFPAFAADGYLAGKFVAALPAEIRDGIARHGIRNSHLTAIAPTGTISLLADNVSSGIEPVFAFECRRLVRDPEDGEQWHELEDLALRRWHEGFGPGRLPPQFVDARQLAPEGHLLMQAALQPYVDNAISKTINVPEEIGFGAFRELYRRAFDLGLKGCTTFRPNPVTGAVIEHSGGMAHCCAVEPEYETT
jgi:ribonucleoside-diphosphate reductase alpha chain